MIKATGNRLVSHDFNDNIGRDGSVFSLSNGTLGIRGELEETAVHSGTAILAGFYDREKITYGEAAYGYPPYNEFTAYAPNALGFRIFYGDEEVSFSACAISGFEKVLDLETGLFSHRYTAETAAGAHLQVEFTRCVPLTCSDLLVISCKITPCGGTGPLKVCTYLTTGDAAAETSSDPRKCRISQNAKTELHSQGEMLLCTKVLERTGCNVTAAAQCTANGRFTGVGRCDGGIYAVYSFDGAAQLTKYAVYRNRECDAAAALSGYLHCTAQQIFSGHRSLLKERYETVGIDIGNTSLKTLVNYSILHLIMTGPPDDRHSIPAKGLSGNGYSGHVFWDAEMYLFPFYLYNFPDTAKNLLRFRCRSLDKARDRAAELSYKGALFPWRTISGRECSAYFPAGTAAFHINGDIAYAADCCISATGDISFLKECALELMLETARFYLSLGFFHESGDFCINAVTGPDEYSALVNNNLYTNLMARHNFLSVLKWLTYLRQEEHDAYETFLAKHHITAEELLDFQNAAEHMKLCRDGDLLLQDENILKREALDLNSIPKENFPLLLHYHPLYIYQKQVCKQADAVMAMMLFPELFTQRERSVSYAFYERITTHDSSLSKGIFSIVGLDLNEVEAAVQFLDQSLRLDIDDLHCNTEDGLHFANIGLTWQIIVRGVFGFQLRDGLAVFAPKQTDLLGSCSFNLRLSGNRLRACLDGDRFSLCLLEGPSMNICIYETDYVLCEVVSVVLREHSPVGSLRSAPLRPKIPNKSTVL